MSHAPAGSAAHEPSEEDQATPVRAATAVTFERAATRLGGRTIWRDVSFSVARGEFVAVLGPNGAGKSTLIKAVLGLLPVAPGSALVLGEPPGAANARIGYLPQRRNFDAGTRIRGIDLVRLGLDGMRWGIPLPGLPRRRREAKQVAEVLELVGAAAYARQPIGELSGGEQQRLLIAQALVRRPELLLLDEPLDSLDLPNQASIASLVRRICQQEQVAVLLVAHDINPILSYLDRVIYLAGGNAIEGRPHEVISSETLSRLYGAPIEVLHASDGRLVVVGQPEAPFVHGDRHGPA
ncbi:MAG: ATP-binding cassette domain-containing protein [Thermoleophilia bacterium]|nr:ATP-binding cassette domain-containing protein [Thermoleophilia bacterium]